MSVKCFCRDFCVTGSVQSVATAVVTKPLYGILLPRDVLMCLEPGKYLGRVSRETDSWLHKTAQKLAQALSHVNRELQFPLLLTHTHLLLTTALGCIFPAIFKFFLKRGLYCEVSNCSANVNLFWPNVSCIL